MAKTIGPLTPVHEMLFSVYPDGFLKGMVHLNIIFSYMKFNKICNLEKKEKRSNANELLQTI